VILLSLVLVVVSATTLAIGVFTSGAALVWTSLVTGLGAVALVAGSVVRRREAPGTGAAAAAAGPVGTAPAGIIPAPSPAPVRTPEVVGSPPPPSPRAEPTAGPGDTPGDVSGTGQVDPWATRPIGGPVRGWSGHVPAERRLPERPAPERPAAEHPAVAAERPAPAAERSAAEPAVAAAGLTGPVEPPRPVEDSWGLPAAADGVEPVAVRDALRVAQLDDEVLVVDGEPRYHLAGCPTLAGETVPLPVATARRGGFVPCATCTPDRLLLERHRTA
jgi:hypothetical protein